MTRGYSKKACAGAAGEQTRRRCTRAARRAHLLPVECVEVCAADTDRIGLDLSKGAASHWQVGRRLIRLVDSLPLSGCSLFVPFSTHQQNLQATAVCEVRRGRSRQREVRAARTQPAPSQCYRIAPSLGIRTVLTISRRLCGGKTRSRSSEDGWLAAQRRGQREGVRRGAAAGRIMSPLNRQSTRSALAASLVLVYYM